MLKCMRSIKSILAFSIIIPSAWAQVTERVSVSSTGMQAGYYSLHSTLSADGRFVAFSSGYSNLVVGDTNGRIDVFVHDRDTGITERVSVNSVGDQGNGGSNFPSISADGRYVAFESRASNLVVGDSYANHDIFVHDRDTGTTERVSVSSDGVQGNDISGSPSISADGSFVAFVSRQSNLVVGDTNNTRDIFVHERATGITERVSVSSAGNQSNGNSYDASISADGRFVAFESLARNLVEGDTNANRDIFIHDRDTGLTERVSVSSSGNQADDRSSSASISADGRLVAFESRADNLVAGSDNIFSDDAVFVHNRDTGMTERVSVSTAGDQGYGRSSSISADGRFVAFESRSSNLVVDDSNLDYDIFVHDRITGITERLSMSTNGFEGNDNSQDPSISANGQFVAFESGASNLVANDTNRYDDIFVAKNDLIDLSDGLTATLRPTSGATQVGEKIRFRARLKNTGTETLSNCRVLIIDPQPSFNLLGSNVGDFNYYSWPLKIANPVINGNVDLAPGEIGQFNLTLIPLVAMRREVLFKYVCDNTRALPLAFVNSLHLTAKTQPLISEDFVQLKNSNKRTELELDRSSSRYWTGYAVNVNNTGNQSSSVNLTTTSHFADVILRQSRLCEPIDPANNNWSCINPRDTHLQVELEPGETKKILVYVHARQPIAKRVIQNRIYLEARDSAGEVVAKASMGISTIN